MEEVGTVYGGAEQGGCRCPDLRPDILDGGPVRHVVQVGYVGDDTPYLEVVGQIPPQGGPQDDGETTLEREGRSVGITLAVGRDGRGGTSGGGDLHLPSP